LDAELSLTSPLALLPNTGQAFPPLLRTSVPHLQRGKDATILPRAGRADDKDHHLWGRHTPLRRATFYGPLAEVAAAQQIVTASLQPQPDEPTIAGRAAAPSPERKQNPGKGHPAPACGGYCSERFQPSLRI